MKQALCSPHYILYFMHTFWVCDLSGPFKLEICSILWRPNLVVCYLISNFDSPCCRAEPKDGNKCWKPQLVVRVHAVPPLFWPRSESRRCQIDSRDQSCAVHWTSLRPGNRSCLVRRYLGRERCRQRRRQKDEVSIIGGSFARIPERRDVPPSIGELRKPIFALIYRRADVIRRFNGKRRSPVKSTGTEKLHPRKLFFAIWMS